jgi:hypothetical protein
MKALVKPATEPYKDAIPENAWTPWIEAHMSYYTEYYGYMLIENYVPPAPPVPSTTSEE